MKKQVRAIEWLAGPCPYCGAKTDWISNIIGDDWEFGRFRCKTCRRSSGFTRFTISEVKV